MDTDEFLKSLKSLQVSRCECSAKNPDSDYPNQHTKACPRFQTMHCWCPPATGPNQPHEKRLLPIQETERQLLDERRERTER